MNELLQALHKLDEAQLVPLALRWVELATEFNMFANQLIVSFQN